MENKTIFTTKEAAEYLGISLSTIYRMEKKGLISAMRTPGGQRRFSKKSIEEYLRKSRKFGAPQNPSLYKKKSLLIREAGDVYKFQAIKQVTTPKPFEVEELFFQTDLIWIYNTDFLRTECIKEGSIDLIVTSPPYNVDIRYNSYDDTIPYDIYLEFTQRWLEKAYKLLKDDGRFCLNIPLDKNKGGQQSVYADITIIAKQIGEK